MDKKQEKWAIFWCDLLSPIIYEQIEAAEINRFLKAKAKEQIQFPDGRVGKASLKTLRRKLNRYREGGFDALARKKRIDRGKPRNFSPEVIDKAIELKKEQPHRSECIINRFLEEMYSVSVPKTTLYRHLKNAGATRLKLGITKTKIRKRWSRDYTHDLWVGDFEDGPYVLEKDNVVAHLFVSIYRLPQPLHCRCPLLLQTKPRCTHRLIYPGTFRSRCTKAALCGQCQSVSL
jgi:putative transposase